MAQFKPIMTTTSSLTSLPIVNGQFIIDKTAGRIYIDSNNQRIEAYEDAVYTIQTLNTSINGIAGVLYIKPSTNELYVWRNNEYVKLSLSSSSAANIYTKQEIDNIIGDVRILTVDKPDVTISNVNYVVGFDQDRVIYKGNGIFSFESIASNGYTYTPLEVDTTGHTDNWITNVNIKLKDNYKWSDGTIDDLVWSINFIYDYNYAGGSR